jgi:RNA polymerase sigma-70 factor, ECF subfamily
MNVNPQQSVQTDEALLIEQLRQGDQAAFTTLVDRYHTGMIRLAQAFVADRSTAEDVAQETWLGVLRGLPSFEGRSSLRTWLYRILINRAKTRGQRDSRVVPFSAQSQSESTSDDNNEVASMLFSTQEPDAQHWISSPQSWQDLPEQRMLSLEVRTFIEQAIATLPESQRAVISLRDLEGWSSVEVCNVLGLSETNQRVLLHRARERVRRALAAYLTPDGADHEQ